MSNKEPLKIGLSAFIFILIILALLIIIIFASLQISKIKKEDSKTIDSLQDTILDLKNEVNTLKNNNNTNSSLNSNNTNNNANNNTTNNDKVNEVILNSSEFANWKIGKTTSSNILALLNGPEEKEDEVMTKDVHITVYKPINSNNISNIKEYIQKHSFIENFQAGDNLSFVTENSNNWMEFSGAIEGNFIYNERVYAMTKNNQLFIIRIEAEESIDNKYKSEINAIVNKIQNSWNTENGNNLSIIIR